MTSDVGGNHPLESLHGPCGSRYCEINTPKSKVRGECLPPPAGGTPQTPKKSFKLEILLWPNHGYTRPGLVQGTALVPGKPALVPRHDSRVRLPLCIGFLRKKIPSRPGGGHGKPLSFTFASGGSAGPVDDNVTDTKHQSTKAPRNKQSKVQTPGVTPQTPASGLEWKTGVGQ